jgi:hypothetical protein
MQATCPRLSIGIQNVKTWQQGSIGGGLVGVKKFKSYGLSRVPGHCEGW